MTNDEIEVLDAELAKDPSLKAGLTVLPSELDQIPIEVKGWALKIYQFRQNLRLGFGSWSGMTKLQKATAIVASGATGGVVGWVTGLWGQLSGLFT